jgi:hypothetical protein
MQFYMIIQWAVFIMLISNYVDDFLGLFDHFKLHFWHTTIFTFIITLQLILLYLHPQLHEIITM